MKILIVRTYPDILNLNSYNVQEVGLAKALALKGHPCDIVLYGGKQADHREHFSFEENGKRYSYTIHWLKGFAFFKNGFMPSLNKLIDDYDIIQVHEYDQIQSSIIYKKCKKPVVIYHGPYYHPYAKGYNFKCRIFDMFFLHGKRYQNVPALTKSIPAKEFLERKGFQNVKAVGVGLDEEKFRSTEKSDKLIPDAEEGTFRMLYVGKIEDRRNVYFLIDVLRRLRCKDFKIELVIIGDGEEDYVRKFLHFIDKELLEGTVIYRKGGSQTQLPRVYQSADLFILASNYDIFGMVLLEAMYFGLPVISSKNGGSLTLIEQGINGYVMDEFEVDEWTAKIEKLTLNKTLYQSMSRMAEKTIKEKYLWGALARRFIHTYQEAAGESVEKDMKEVET